MLPRSQAVAIGDGHFGPGPRNADRYASLDRIIERGLALPHLGIWLWAGDVNHARMTIEDRNALEVRVQRMAAAAPVVMTYGNHDLAGDLDSFSRLAAPWPIYVAALPGVIEIKLATRAMLALFVLPYPTRAGLVAAGVSSPLLGQVGRDALAPIFLKAADELLEARSRGRYAAMIGHVNVAGAVSSVGQPQIGQEIELDVALLDGLGPIPKIVNHIHKHQAIGGAVYPGSIARLDFGELEPKGFLVLEFSGEIDADRVPPADKFEIRFESLDVAPMYHIEGELRPGQFTYGIVKGDERIPILRRGTIDLLKMTELGTEALTAEAVINAPPDWTGADVRVRYRFKKAEIGALDVALIHAEFAGCRTLKLDPVPTLEHEIRAPEIVAAPTLEGKVIAYCARHGLDYSAGLEAKLSALQAPGEAATLLATVTAAAERAGAEEVLA